MNAVILANRPVFLAGATATLVLAAMSFSGSAHARDDVFWSVGLGGPGVSLNVGNAGPVYLQAQPVHVQPAPIYYRPRPVWVRPAPVYLQYQPVYQARGWNRRHGGQYVVPAAEAGYGAGYYRSGYAPVSQAYYPQDGRNDQWRNARHEDRR